MVNYTFDMNLNNIPLYKRRLEIIENLDLLKKQLKKDGFEPERIRSVSCYAQDLKMATCIINLHDKKEGSFKEMVEDYRDMVNTKGDYDNPGSRYRGSPEIRKEIEAKVKELYPDKISYNKRWKQISKLTFLRNAEPREVSIPPFKISRGVRAKEEKWLQALDEANVPNELALKLETILRD